MIWPEKHLEILLAIIFHLIRFGKILLELKITHSKGQCKTNKITPLWEVFQKLKHILIKPQKYIFDKDLLARGQKIQQSRKLLSWLKVENGFYHNFNAFFIV